MNDIFIMTNPEYNEGVLVTTYKGKYRLIAAKQGKDKVFQTWADVEIGKDKKKRLPVSVNLGADPVAVLEKIREAISDENPF